MKPAILICDDEVPVRLTLRRFLESLEVGDVLEAGNGQEALEQIKATPEVKFLLLDLMMPVMDGLQTLRKLRSFNQEIKVAILTGFPSYEQADQVAKELDVLDFITKPVDLDYLEHAVREALSDGQSAPAS
jgi:two-component system, response regulator YesN